MSMNKINRYFTVKYGDCKLVHNAPLWAIDLVKGLHNKIGDGKDNSDTCSDWVMRVCRMIEGHISAGSFVVGELSNEHILDLISGDDLEFYQWAVDHCRYTFFDNARNKCSGYAYNNDIEYLKSLQSFVIKDIINKVYQGHLEEYNATEKKQKYVVEFEEVHHRIMGVEAYSVEEAEMLVKKRFIINLDKSRLSCSNINIKCTKTSKFS